MLVFDLGCFTTLLEWLLVAPICSLLTVDLLGLIMT